MAKKQITLNEQQLREFVSYSVARILKEAMGRPIFDKYGEYDGSEESDYGEDSFVFEPDLDEYLSDEVDFPSPIQVEVSFTREEGMKGDGYMQPDDPDSYELDSWRIVNDDIPMEVRREVENAVNQYMENDFDLEAEASERGGLYEENKGAMFHSDGKNAFEPKNPYANMTWKEYCAAKAKEREDEKEREKLRDLNKPKGGKKNLGVTAHYNGKKEKIHVGKDEIDEMIRKAIKSLK